MMPKPENVASHRVAVVIFAYTAKQAKRFADQLRTMFAGIEIEVTEHQKTAVIEEVPAVADGGTAAPKPARVDGGPDRPFSAGDKLRDLFAPETAIEVVETTESGFTIRETKGEVSVDRVVFWDAAVCFEIVNPPGTPAPLDPPVENPTDKLETETIPPETTPPAPAVVENAETSGAPTPSPFPNGNPLSLGDVVTDDLKPGLKFAVTETTKTGFTVEGKDGVSHTYVWKTASRFTKE